MANIDWYTRCHFSRVWLESCKELSLIYFQSALTTMKLLTCFFQYINASNHWMNYLKMIYEYLRQFWHLRKGTNVKFMRWYLELFLGRDNYENLLEYQVDWNCFWSPIVKWFKMNVTTYIYFKNKEMPNKAPDVLYNGIWTRPEAGPN